MTSPTQVVVRMIKILLFQATVIALCVSAALASDVSIYSDNLADGWSDSSWSTTRNFANGSPVHGGTKSISVRFDAGWAGLSLHADPAVDLSGYGLELRFWVYGNTTGNQSIQLIVNNAGCVAVHVATVVNKWTEVRIPFSELGSPAALSDLTWQDTTNKSQSVFYLDDITVAKPTIPPQVPLAGPDLSINAASGRHPISPDIYGMNYAGEQLAAELRLPVRRWGGNSTSRYNWQASIHNTGSDWYFENIPDGAAVADGSASDRFVDQDRRTGTKTLMTVPLIGWTPRSDSPRDHPYACGFKVSKYGAQPATDYPWDTDCGNGINSNGSTITGNNPLDTSTAIDTDFVTAWINHLTTKYSTSSSGGVAYYDLDNEPMLWNSTHRDVHPQATTYDEMRDRTYQYAAAVKSADPSAKTLGPVLWGWCAYFYSALDECGVKDGDYNAHNQTYFVPWYLQQMKAYEQLNGVRILDYLDLHNYPAAGGVSLSPACSATTQSLRLRSTRSLWDPAYIDESWISDTAPGGVAVKLIPRMKEWVDTNYPGTKLAITEYNWGGLEGINGALSQADVLGIFGREGLDLATIWGTPESNQPGAFAFRIYRNYDGAGHGFGDTGVQAISADQDKLAVYAARRGVDNALTIVVINKSASDRTSNITLAGIIPQPTASVYRYSPANLKAIEHLADQAVTTTGFNSTFPANSITLFEIKSETIVTSDFNGDGKPDILWRDSSSGQNVVWYMNGTTHTGDGSIQSVPVNWQIVGTGDFNGDVKPDVLWRDSTTGQNVVWYMDGTAHTGDGSIQSVPVNWQIVGTGDFNGDGKSDILWRDSTTGQNVVWYMDGTAHTGDGSIQSVPVNWKIVGAGDFNGDGKSDILWRDTTTGQNVVWYMDGTTHTGDGSIQSVPVNWQIVGAGDFNADVKPDVLWRDSATGQIIIWLMDGTNHTGDVSLGSVPVNWKIVGM